MHNAGMMLSAADAAKVNSVVMFGDPKNSTSVGAIPTEKVSVVCHDTDNICMGGNKILQAHLTASIIKFLRCPLLNYLCTVFDECHRSGKLRVSKGWCQSLKLDIPIVDYSY